MSGQGYMNPRFVSKDELRRRIAALEAENERLQGVMGICSGPCHGHAGPEYIVKVHEVVAELAALKAQPAIHKEYDFACPQCGLQAVLSFDLLPLEAERGTG